MRGGRLLLGGGIGRGDRFEEGGRRIVKDGGGVWRPLCGCCWNWKIMANVLRSEAAVRARLSFELMLEHTCCSVEG